MTGTIVVGALGAWSASSIGLGLLLGAVLRRRDQEDRPSGRALALTVPASAGVPHQRLAEGPRVLGRGVEVAAPHAS